MSTHRARRKKPTAHVDDVLHGYITAALWSTNDESDESGGEPLDKNYGPSDVDPATVRKMRADIVKFLRENKKAVNAYTTHRQHSREHGNVWEYLGHDLWLSRNGHGTGFWDRNYDGEDWIGEQLDKAAHKLGESYLYVGDDGRIYA